MHYSERHEKIIEILAERNSATVHYFAKALYVSEPTIRRDLAFLEKSGKVRRTFGGAVLFDNKKDEVPLMLRENENVEQKEIIAKKASELLADGQTIFLDASSTSSKLLKYLHSYKSLTVITNSPKTSLKLAELRIKSFCTGGLLLENSIAYVGAQAISFVRNFNADLFFFSCRGISREGILSDSSIEETELRKAMMQQSKRNIFLCTDDKIGKSYMYNLCSVSNIDKMICNTDLPDFQ